MAVLETLKAMRDERGRWNEALEDFKSFASEACAAYEALCLLAEPNLLGQPNKAHPSLASEASAGQAERFERELREARESLGRLRKAARGIKRTALSAPLGAREGAQQVAQMHARELEAKSEALEHLGRAATEGDLTAVRFLVANETASPPDKLADAWPLAFADE